MPSYEAIKVVQSVVFPKQIKHISAHPGEGRYFIDFGKDSWSSLRLKVVNPVEGWVVEIHMGEKSLGDTVDRKPPGTVRYQKHEVTLKAGETEYAIVPTFDDKYHAPVFAQKETGEVMPFRYVEMVNAPKGFATEHIWQLMSHVPFQDGDGAGMFESSDQDLNAVYDMCKYTIKAGSAFGIFVDGDRERKPWEGDGVVANLGSYCIGPQYELGRVTHEYLLTHPTWPTEWMQDSILMGYQHHMFSGDSSSLKKHYDVIKTKLMLERREPSGLFKTPKGLPNHLIDIIDWPAVYRDGYDMAVAINPVTTAMHYHTLVLMAQIANVVGKPQSEQDMFETMAKQTYKAFNETLWDEANGCYPDGIDDKGVQSKHVSAHANFFPLALGLVPDDRVDRVVAYLKSRNMETNGLACGVYAAQWLMEGLYAHGEGDLALKLLTCKAENSWLNMIKNGCTMTSETWNAVIPNTDWTWTHIWGASPANIIPRLLMGIQPMEPGFTKFSVQPQPGSLKSAKGKMPTPYGLVEVDVTDNTAGSFKMTLVVPVGTVARVGLPTLGNNNSNQVVVNGNFTEGIVVKKTVWVDNVTPGTYKIERSSKQYVKPSYQHPTHYVKHVLVDDDNSGIVWRLIKSVLAGLQWLVTFWWAYVFNCSTGGRDVSDAEYTLVEADDSN